jgi:cytochrome c biogenesis protein CcdA/thiol-disulfide isomerase/thioredoxin
METEIISISLGFIEGFSLIISPCILPILPIILAASLAGSKRRPLGIITGFILTFSFVAFFSRNIVQYSSIDLNVIRHASYAVLFLLAFIMMSNNLTRIFMRITQQLSKIATLFATKNMRSGFFSGLFVGGLVAIIWTPCAGPILAAVIVLIVIQKTSLISFLTLLAFAFGVGVPMFVIACYGVFIRDSLGFFKTRALFFRKILGFIIMISIGYMIYQERGGNLSSVKQTMIKTSTSLKHGLWRPYQAPELGGITAWLNSPPLNIAHLKGKVVLIDFWTYSCINCLRTLPYLKDWYAKYKDKGLVIIGVHTPEFDFEKNLENVSNAVIRYGIQYPVALDNQFLTWRRFNNHYWPAHYLIDKKGNVVYQHFGEGEYDVMENNLRFLLGIDQLIRLPTPLPQLSFETPSPETYLGYQRANTSLSPPLIHDNSAEYHMAPKLMINAWGLQGAWQVKADKILAAGAHAALSIHFKARKVFVVMGNSTTKPIRVNLLLNGKSLTSGKGSDVSSDGVLVKQHTIYEILALKQFTAGVLQITASEPGLEVYTFTFGL